jgi:hypothetical protein
MLFYPDLVHTEAEFSRNGTAQELSGSTCQTLLQLNN